MNINKDMTTVKKLKYMNGFIPYTVKTFWIIETMLTFHTHMSAYFEYQSLIGFL